MTHGSLFSGIGGFDLAAEWMGWENIFHCEWNEFGQKVLKHYWPNAISYNDITKTDFTIHRGQIDILTGGFPCQPYSTAGKRLGKEDERHLWPEMLRAIREIQPRWVVGENVYGLVNWSGGMVFNEVQADLEAEGYEVQPYVLPAVSVNAPHRRDRVWFVAKNTNEDGRRSKQWESQSGEREQRDTGTGDNERVQTDNAEAGSYTNPNGDGCNGSNSQHEVNTSKGGEYAQHDVEHGNEEGNAANTCNTGLQGREFDGTFNQEGQKRRQQPSRSIAELHQIGPWDYFPTQSPVCGGDDGFPTGLDGITFSKWREESIKAFGNAIVPHVALQIFKAINNYEN
jgi:DNA (cytosine-5)-methyltransferase 1